LTGQYVYTHGIRDNTNRSAASHQLRTFPAILKENRYATAYIGKWHMGNDSTPRPGFDRWVSFKGQGAYVDPLLNIDGKESTATGYMTDLLTKHAVDFVRTERFRPFVLCLAHKAVHGPFTPAERHMNLYADATFTPPPNVMKMAESRAQKPLLPQPANRPGPPMVTDGKAEAKTFPNMINQLRCLAAIDEGVGELLKALEETKQLENTVFVFTSDNGFFWREHGLGDKRWAYDESVRDPLLIRYPKLIKPGTRVEQLAVNIDLAPTFLDLAGVPIPATMQGRSLKPLLAGEKTAWRTSILMEYFRDGQFAIPPWQAVRTDLWKYIHYPESEKHDELYDLQADPYEMRNVIQEAAARERLVELKQELTRLARERDGTR
jgi:N-acetylglucosamine-6-sulfatase